MSDAEIQLLGQISDTLSALNRRMEKQEEVSTKTLAALARLEERSVNTAKLEERIEKVESSLGTRLNNHADRLRTVEQKVEGAGLAAGWISRVWPILAGIAGGAVTWLGLNHN